MTSKAQNFIDRMKNKEKLTYLELSNQELTGNINLANFTSLTRINAFKNKFASLEFLLSLPSKEKLKKLNFWGNKISSLGDALKIFSEFPKLEIINLSENPLNLSRISNLNDEQVLELSELIESEKIKIGSAERETLNYIKQLRKEIATLQQQIQAQVEVPPK